MDGNLGMEVSNLSKVSQLEYGDTGLQARKSGFPADILNYMLEETPSGNLNWDFFFFFWSIPPHKGSRPQRSGL